MPDTAIVVLSHGDLAKGFADAARMIAGVQPKVYWVGLGEGEGPEAFRGKVEQVLASLEGDDVLFLVDLFGGTPSNVASMLFLENVRGVASRPRRLAIVSGVNLGILLEALANRQAMGVEELASHLVDASSSTVVNVGQLLLGEARGKA